MSELKHTFKKPYDFEGETYHEVDLGGLDSLTGKDIIDADKQFSANGSMAIMNEMTVSYSCILAAKATKLPVEFFQSLPAHEIVKIKNMVMGFLNG